MLSTFGFRIAEMKVSLDKAVGSSRLKVFQDSLGSPSLKISVLFS